MQNLDHYLQNSTSLGLINAQPHTSSLGRTSSSQVVPQPNPNQTYASLSSSMQQISQPAGLQTQVSTDIQIKLGEFVQILASTSDAVPAVFNIEAFELETREPLIDMSFDWKGERVAIVTADRRVLIYNKTADGKWLKNSEYNPHNGPIWKVKWAHEYLGNFLATCSYDRKIAIYEENIRMETDEQGYPTKKSFWENRGLISRQASASVEDIKFAPLFKGLVLAACTAEGKLYMHDLRSKIEIKDPICINIGTEALTTISWNKNQEDDVTILVGSRAPDDPGKTSTISLWQLFSGQDKPKWELYSNMYFAGKPVQTQNVYDISWAPLNGRSFHYAASCGDEGVFVWRFKFANAAKGISPGELNILDVKNFKPEIQSEASSATTYSTTCVSWNLMVVSS